MARHEPHPVCRKLRELRRASGLSLQDMEDKHGVNSVLMGSYERGDRIPPLPKIDALLKLFGHRITTEPADDDAIRVSSDIAGDLRAIANQLEKNGEQIADPRDGAGAQLRTDRDLSYPAKA